jgi:hypothetical protein
LTTIDRYEIESFFAQDAVGYSISYLLARLRQLKVSHTGSATDLPLSVTVSNSALVKAVVEVAQNPKLIMSFGFEVWADATSDHCSMTGTGNSSR